MCETAKRFFSAMVTDALMMRIIGDDHPDPAGLAEELGEQVVGVAAKELGELSQENRVALLDMQLERFKQTIATAARYAYRTKAHGTIDLEAQGFRNPGPMLVQHVTDAIAREEEEQPGGECRRYINYAELLNDTPELVVEPRDRLRTRAVRRRES